MSISDWSSDVCSSDLRPVITYGFSDDADLHACDVRPKGSGAHFTVCFDDGKPEARREAFHLNLPGEHNVQNALAAIAIGRELGVRSEEHTSELQSLMRISYAVFCLKKKKNKTP